MKLEVSEKFCPDCEIDPPNELQTTQQRMLLMLDLQRTTNRAGFYRHHLL